MDEVRRDAVGAVQCSSNKKRLLCPGDWLCLTSDWWLALWETGDWMYVSSFANDSVDKRRGRWVE